MTRRPRGTYWDEEPAVGVAEDDGATSGSHGVATRVARAIIASMELGSTTSPWYEPNELARTRYWSVGGADYKVAIVKREERERHFYKEKEIWREREGSVEERERERGHDELEEETRARQRRRTPENMAAIGRGSWGGRGKKGHYGPITPFTFLLKFSEWGEITLFPFLK